MEIPKVSVFIITYNQEEFIAETLDSVLMQDYDNFDIIIGNDASTDRTTEIINGYQKKHPDKIKHIENKTNLGITKNCNVVLKACDGELIAVLGGDDLFLPGKIRLQAKQFMDNSDLMMSYHPVEVFESETGKVLIRTNQITEDDTNSALDIIEKCGIPGASSVMFRKEAIPKGGFNERIPTASDWLFYIELAMSGKVEKLPQLLGKYRKHSGGASNSTLELLGESLATLDIVIEKYPERSDIVSACKKGKARYIAGEAFRQLEKSPKTSRKLFEDALRHTPSNKKFVVGKILASFGPLSILIGKILNNYRYLIKQYFK